MVYCSKPAGAQGRGRDDQDRTGQAQCDDKWDAGHANPGGSKMRSIAQQKSSAVPIMQYGGVCLGVLRAASSSEKWLRSHNGPFANSGVRQQTR